MQPCDAALPIELGTFVPWMPYPFLFNPIQRVPESFGGTFSSSQRVLCDAGIRFRLQALGQLLTPDLRMMHVRRRVQREIAAGLVAGAVHFAQATGFFLRDPRNL